MVADPVAADSRVAAPQDQSGEQAPQMGAPRFAVPMVTPIAKVTPVSSTTKMQRFETSSMDCGSLASGAAVTSSPLSTAVGSCSNTTGGAASPDDRRWSCSSSLECDNVHNDETDRIRSSSETPKPQDRWTVAAAVNCEGETSLTETAAVTGSSKNRFARTMWSIISRQERQTVSSENSKATRPDEKSAKNGPDEKTMEQKIKELRDRANHVLVENEALLSQQAQLREELKFKDKTLRDLSHTNSHCRSLLNRNSELEQLICEIQTEAETNISEARESARENARRAGLAENQLADLQIELEDARRTLAELSSVQSAARCGSLDFAAVKTEVAKQKETIAALEAAKKASEKIAQFHQAEAERLRQLVEGQLSSVSDTALEIANLAAANRTLEQSIAELADTHRTELAQRRVELVEAESKTQALTTELERAREQLAQRERDHEPLMVKLQAVQTKLAEVEHSRRTQIEEIERLKLVADENSLAAIHAAADLERLKLERKSLKGIHNKCEELLTQNAALTEQENLLKSEIRRLSVLKNESAAENQRISESVRQLSLSLRESSAEVNAKSEEIKILKSTIEFLKQKLTTAENRNLDQLNSRNAVETAEAVKKAVANVMEITAKEKRREIERLTAHYEQLLDSIRHSHAAEISNVTTEFDQKAREMLRSQLIQWEDERARDGETMEAHYARSLDQMSRVHAEQMKKYRDELERSLTVLQEKKEEEWRERLKEREEGHRMAQREMEDRLAAVVRRYEEKLEEEMARSDDMKVVINSQEGEVTKLCTRVEHLENLLAKAAAESRAAVEAGRKEMDEITSRRLSSLREDYETQLRNETQRYETLKEKLQGQIKQLKAEAAMRSNRPVTETERAFTTVAASEKFAETVDAATAELVRQVETLKSELSDSRIERARAEEESRANLTKVITLQEQLAAAKSELNTNRTGLANILASYEASKTEHCEELKLLNSDVSQTVDLAGLEFLLRRNQELEEMVANLSEQHHDEMISAKRASVEAAATIQRLTQKVSALSSAPADTVAARRRSSAAEIAAAEQQHELENLVLKLQKEKSIVQREWELEKVKISSLQDALKQNGQAEERRAALDAFIDRLKDLDTNLKRFVAQNARTWKETVQAVEDGAKQKALAAQVAFLEEQTAKSRERISALETELQQKGNEQSTGTNSDETLMHSFRTLRKERTKLREDCHVLEDKLNEQIVRLKGLIDSKNDQLEQLQSANKKSADLLARNTELEEQILRLIQMSTTGHIDRTEEEIGVNSISTSQSTVVELNQLLISFQNEFAQDAERLKKDANELNAALERRDTEISNLQRELSSLRNSLEIAFAKKIESEKIRLQSESDQLRKENGSLKLNVVRLEADLLSVRRHMEISREESDGALNDMLLNLSNKIKYHQLMVAEIQEQRDSETSRMMALLNSSRTAQLSLQEEIEKISSDLATKDQSIRDMSVSLGAFLTEIEDRVGDSDGTAVDSTATVATTETNNTHSVLIRLKQLFETLVDRLSGSQLEAQKLMDNFRRLLALQRDQLAESERVRTEMESLVEQSELTQNVTGILNTVYDAEITLTTTDKTTTKTTTVNSIGTDDSNTERHSLMKANEKLLEMLSEKESQRDREIANLRSQLASLEIWSLDPSKHGEQCVAEYAKAQRAGLASIHEGVEQLVSSMNDLNRLKELLVVKRRSGGDTLDTWATESTVHSILTDNGEAAEEDDRSGYTHKRARIE